GTYKAVKQNGGGVCPELTDLIDFEMVVRDGPRGQIATFGFLERQEALAGHRPFSRDGEITQYGFRLARQVSVDEDTAGVSERTRKRNSHPQSKEALQKYSTKDAGTPVNGRQEQVWNHAYDAAIPSFELPTTAQSTSLGAQQAVSWIDTSFQAQGAYYSPLPAELFAGYSRGTLAPPEHSSISTIIPSSGRHNRSGVVEGWAVIPDGQYETTNDVDQLERVTVEIRSELQTGQRRVQLTAKFKGFEMQFSEETAVFFGDCLHLDFSAEFHDSDMFIFKDSLKFHYVYPSSFRICRRAAGEWFFMFDARRHRQGAATSTVHLMLRQVVPRKEYYSSRACEPLLYAILTPSFRTI
ncbi:hypothetical protein FOZ63_023710, partial [Perkinsus olseni]